MFGIRTCWGQFYFIWAPSNLPTWATLKTQSGRHGAFLACGTSPEVLQGILAVCRNP